MNRLLRIALDISLCSLFPILTWFALSLTIEPRVLNVFSITYPFQFFVGMMLSIFSTGANISRTKDGNENAAMMGLTLGSITGIAVFGISILNINLYLEYMNMEGAIYKTFAIYSLIHMYMQMILQFVLNKLYYDGENARANKYSILFNISSFLSIIGSSLLLDSESMAITISLCIVGSFVLVVAVKESTPFHIKGNLLNFVKYDCIDLSTSFIFLLTYFFGLGNAFGYGDKYINAINFVVLITDFQWDVSAAVWTVAKIDISKNTFNYKSHLKNAYKLILILLASIGAMFFFAYPLYEISLDIVLILLLGDIVNFIVDLHWGLKKYYLSIEHSYKLMTTHNIIAFGLRFIMSFLHTPYCMKIGQLAAMAYNYIVSNCIFYKNFQVEERGRVGKREE